MERYLLEGRGKSSFCPLGSCSCSAMVVRSPLSGSGTSRGLCMHIFPVLVLEWREVPWFRLAREHHAARAQWSPSSCVYWSMSMDQMFSLDFTPGFFFLSKI